jgi:hypothetical protein
MSDHPDRADVIRQAKADLLAAGIDLRGTCGAFQITELAAWRMRADGAGLLVKTSGDNCRGFSKDVICFADGTGYDVLVDAGGENVPTWQRKDDNFAAGWAPANPVPDPVAGGGDGGDGGDGGGGGNGGAGAVAALQAAIERLGEQVQVLAGITQMNNMRLRELTDRLAALQSGGLRVHL